MTDPKHEPVEIDLSLIKEAVDDHFGERCLDYDADCSCCQAWDDVDQIEALTAQLDALKEENERLKAPSPQPNLRGIKRYDEHPDGGGMREDVLGAYVKSEDILHLFVGRDTTAEAEALARQIWGYFKGDSTGGSTAMQWFDNNKSLGGPAHVIKLCRRALGREKS